ncbi:hypothetical protein NQ854_07740 [Rhodococcus ruber]|uniref:hypothetical protein n=1 Tax=Rhodococcus ruber TaxID=1830 RepID=UPI00387DC768
MSEPTCLPASIVADTIMRTIELGVTITDAALDDQVTVVFCDLLTDGPNRCPSCSQAGTYRDTIVRTVRPCRWPATRCSYGCGCPATA